jgi:hypothetical protein
MPDLKKKLSNAYSDAIASALTRSPNTPQGQFVSQPMPFQSPLQAELESDIYGVPRLAGSLDLGRGFQCARPRNAVGRRAYGLEGNAQILPSARSGLG